MKTPGVVVAIYDSHVAAEEGVVALVRSGIDMKKISIVGRDYYSEEHAVGYFNMGERLHFFGKLGAFWGGLAGLLFGAFVMVVPLFGHLIVLGPLASTIVSGVEGAVLGGGTGAIVGALTGIGVPKDSALRYETALKADKFLLILQGSEADLELAGRVLAPTSPSSLETHGLRHEETAAE